MTVYDLPYVGEADLKLLREAKAALNVEWKILPREARAGDERVLCFGGVVPVFACDSFISKRWTAETLQDAMKMCVGEMPLDNRVKRVHTWLEETLGRKGVKELG